MVKSQKSQKAGSSAKEAQGNMRVFDERLTESLAENLETLKTALCNSSDLVAHEFSFGHNQIRAALVYVDGLVDLRLINESIIEPLMYHSGSLDLRVKNDKCDIEIIKKAMLVSANVKEEHTIDLLIDGCLSGNVILLVEHSDRGLLVNCRGGEKRSIEEPSSESVIRGPREGFTESLRTNTAMVRKKIKNPSLTFDTRILGKKTRTSVCVAYIKGLTNQTLIENIQKRLDKINTDAILESGYIEQYIEDAPFSIFATIGHTEKPDVVAAKLLEGRAAIFIDGTPFVLTAPFLLEESFQTAEDYYDRPYFMTMLRLTRYVAFFLTILAPALYVAVTTFHQELLPTELLFTMVAAREGVPFPSVIEAFVMLVAFEILREAGVRLPKPVGQAMSIVGALIMGEAAVSAGLIGSPMVVVIAITTVATFAVPSQADAAALLRLYYLILAGIMGGFGITIGLLATLAHLSSLKSFGHPYLAPIAPLQVDGLGDSIIRIPLWMMITRPKNMADRDRTRQKFFIPPPFDEEDGSENQDGEQ